MTTIKEISQEQLNGEVVLSKTSSKNTPFIGKFKGHSKSIKGAFHAHTSRHRKQVIDVLSAKERVVKSIKSSNRS